MLFGRIFHNCSMGLNRSSVEGFTVGLSVSSRILSSGCISIGSLLEATRLYNPSKNPGTVSRCRWPAIHPSIPFSIYPRLLYLYKPISEVESYNGHIYFGIVKLLVILIEVLPPELEIEPEILVRAVIIKLGKTFEMGQ